MSAAGLYLLLLLAYPLIQSLTTLVHELGHALPALWLSPSDKVEVYINSYGKKEGAFRFRAGRLTLFYQPSLWKGFGRGLTRYDRPARRYAYRYCIIAGGVLSTLLTAGVLLLIARQAHLADAWQAAAIVFFAAAIVDLVLNLLPSARTIPVYGGQVADNDGQRLWQLWAFRRIEQPLHRAQAAYYAGQRQQAVHFLQDLPPGRLSPEACRWILTVAEGSEAPASQLAVLIRRAKEGLSRAHESSAQ